MNKQHVNSHGKQRQGGVALAVSLILLAVITLLSLSAMRSANLNTKIAVNHQHKQFAFQAAESALAHMLNDKLDGSLSLPINEDADPAENVDWFAPVAVANSANVSADLTMDLIRISEPGELKLSGYGLNAIGVIYQADAFGEVDGTNATAHNRMEVVLVRY